MIHQNKIEFRLRLILFVFAFLIYANTLNHDFAWDDSIVITENPRVKMGLKGIPDLFIKYNSEYKSDKYGYRPIVLISYAIEYTFFKDNAKPGHFMNVLYFGILCVVLYNLLRKLFPVFKNSLAFFSCLIFIAHPVHTEVVANIKSRDEIFALLFALLSCSHLKEYTTFKKIKHLIFAILLFLMAFLSKESAVIFLILIPLYFLQTTTAVSFKNLIKPTLLIVCIGLLCFLIIKLYTSSQYGSQASLGSGIYHESGILGNSFFYTSVLVTKLANALLILMLYLKNFFYPVQQLYYYGYNQIPVANWGQSIVIISLLIHLSLFSIAFLQFKKNKVLSFAIIFYLISISIYTHLLRTLADTMADRFLFTPSIGLCLILCLIIAKIFKINFKKLSVDDLIRTNPRIKSRGFQITMSIILIAFVLKTVARNKVWKNDESLISNDMPHLENCARAHNYYADVLQKKLASNYDVKTETLMIEHYLKSIAISNASYYSYVGLGNYYKKIKKYNLAISLFDSMCQIYPNQADPHYYLGDSYLQINEPIKALGHLKKSLALAPNVPSTYFSLGLTYSKLGEFEKAISTIKMAISKFGESSNFSEALGIIYFEKGDLEKSTQNTLQLIKYGVDAQTIYKIIIGRYQFNKQDSMAALIYKDAVAKGVFR